MKEQSADWWEGYWEGKKSGFNEGERKAFARIEAVARKWLQIHILCPLVDEKTWVIGGIHKPEGLQHRQTGNSFKEALEKVERMIRGGGEE